MPLVISDTILRRNKIGILNATHVSTHSQIINIKIDWVIILFISVVAARKATLIKLEPL